MTDPAPDVSAPEGAGEATTAGEATCVPLDDGSYRLSWRLVRSGLYSLSVACDGVPVTANALPLQMPVVPGPPTSLQLSLLGAAALTGDGGGIEAGHRAAIRVRPVDAFGNAISTPLTPETRLKLTAGAPAAEGDPGSHMILGETWRLLPEAEGGGAIVSTAIGGAAGASRLAVRCVPR